MFLKMFFLPARNNASLYNNSHPPFEVSSKANFKIPQGMQIREKKMSKNTRILKNFTFLSKKPASEINPKEKTFKPPLIQPSIQKSKKLFTQIKQKIIGAMKTTFSPPRFPSTRA